MQGRRNYSSGVIWEDKAGYSRAVRSGDRIHVSGTTATDAEGELVGEGDAYAQAKQTLANVEVALRALGARFSDVVRTRIYVTNMEDWQDVARAHEEAFGPVRPATSLVAIAALIDPRMLVEIEAEAHLVEVDDR